MRHIINKVFIKESDIISASEKLAKYFIKRYKLDKPFTRKELLQLAKFYKPFSLKFFLIHFIDRLECSYDIFTANMDNENVDREEFLADRGGEGCSVINTHYGVKHFNGKEITLYDKKFSTKKKKVKVKKKLKSKKLIKG